jgi:hypothetical protein
MDDERMTEILTKINLGEPVDVSLLDEFEALLAACDDEQIVEFATQSFVSGLLFRKLDLPRAERACRGLIAAGASRLLPMLGNILLAQGDLVGGREAHARAARELREPLT